MINIEKIPGLIEPVEQNMLINLASNADLSKGVIVEFGTYFGKSTACLINGILKNSSAISKKIHLYSYDAFEASIGDDLYKLVLYHAKISKLENALSIDNSKINFRNIYNYFLGSYEEKIIKTTEIQIKNLKKFNHNIQLIFIDCPKTFKNFIYILDNFFPLLNVNSTLMFQDYFFHWSSSLIAFVQLLLNDKKIEIKATAASSLVVKLVDKIDPVYIKKIKDLIRKNDLNLLIQQSRNNFSLNNMDRYYQFYPRLILAHLEYAYNNSPKDVGGIMKFYLSDKKCVNLNTINDLSDLISHKFIIDNSIK